MVHDELDIFSRLDDSGVGVATLQRICRIVEDLSTCKAFAITRRVEDDLTQFDELVDGRHIATIPVDCPTDNAVARKQMHFSAQSATRGRSNRFLVA